MKIASKNIVKRNVRVRVAGDYTPSTVSPPQQQIAQMKSAKKAPLKLQSYSTFLDELDNSEIFSVRILPSSPTVEYIKNDGNREIANVLVSESLIEKLNDKDVDVTIVNKLENPINAALNFIGMIFPFVFLYAIFSSIRRGGNMPIPFGKSNYDLEVAQQTGVKFDDVAGIDSEKREISELVDFLKNPARYQDAGAKVPKGCLLCGPPGSGKTLLAKAIAGEAGVPFISCSASQFIELFVGLGASRIRGLFETARKNAPCIIFIDEIDAIAKQRGGAVTAGGGGNDEREQTLNQLLTEMDGFEDNTGVILIGATNREDVIDPALMRPGRFDRKIRVSLPDARGREMVLGVHARNKNLDSKVSLKNLAQKTIGCSGAELMNIMNEAAIYAAREDSKVISNENINNAYEKVTIGLPKDRIYDSETKKLVAYHEAGHALVGMLVKNFDKLEKITILPRGGAGGFTQFLPKDENELGMFTREYLDNKLTVALGGRAAEELVFGSMKVTTGASGDLMSVTQVARAMVMKYGFSDKLGTWNLENPSPDVQSQIDDEVRVLVARAYAHALQLLSENRKRLDELALLLIENETLSMDNIKCAENM
jgi:cell division protease FtsH